MADARAFVASLIPSLIPIPAAQINVCSVCRGGTDRYERCYQCHQALQLFRSLPALLPITLMTRESPIYEALRGYKNPATTAKVRTRHGRTAAALLATFLRSHRLCIGDFDCVTAVPSQNRTAVHGLIEQIASIKDAYEPVLIPVRRWKDRELAADRYQTVRGTEGKRILVIDDTFTSGATIFSACETLRQSGAEVVGPVVIGRFLRLEYGPSARLAEKLRDVPWVDTSCTRCDDDGGVTFSDGPPGRMF